MTSLTGAGTASVMRLVPAQKRSRERFERILAAAAALLVEKGADGFRMSELVRRSGVPFGSLYQYFPDKTAVLGTLAERCNEEGRICVARELAGLRQPADRAPVLIRITDGFFRMYQANPILGALWQATQADPVLQRLDARECVHLAEMLAGAQRGAGQPEAQTTDARITAQATLMITLIGTVVRHAITLPAPEAELVLEEFRQLLLR